MLFDEHPQFYFARMRNSNSKMYISYGKSRLTFKKYKPERQFFISYRETLPINFQKSRLFFALILRERLEKPKENFYRRDKNIFFL